MAITTYTGLLASLAAWTDRDDMGAIWPDMIALCEEAAFEELRISRMIQRDTATIDTDNRFSSVPGNYLEVISYSLSDGTTANDLSPTTIQQIADYRSRNDTAGRPRFYCINGTSAGREFEHYPEPDMAYTGTLTFYGKPTPLSPTNASNWLLADAPSVYLYGTLLQAAPYLRDSEQISIWNAGYTAGLDRLRRSDPTKAGKLRTDVGLSARSGAYDITRDI